MMKKSESTDSETQNEQAQVWLTPEQIDAMRDAATDIGAKYLRARNEALVTLLPDTGLRNGVEQLLLLVTGHHQLAPQEAPLNPTVGYGSHHPFIL